jgi:hypothetical protein
MSFNQILLEIFEITSQNPNLNFYNSGAVQINTSLKKDLLSINSNSITTTVPNFWNTFTGTKSKLKDQIIDLKTLNTLVKNMTEKDEIVRLNHVGFCYKVSSQAEEKLRLLQAIKRSSLHLYQEESINDDLWFFVGDIENSWQDPLVEYVLINNSIDKWIEYWLPHVQIDIDTTLNVDEIEQRIQQIFGNTAKPFRLLIIDGVTYIVRFRLGVINGININLDVATKSRNVQLHRKNTLKIVA